MSEYFWADEMEVDYKGQRAVINIERCIKDLMSLVINQNTCEDKKVVCVLLNVNNHIISYGVNVKQAACGDAYCECKHAEIDAIEHLLDAEGYEPYTAVIYGQDFFCEECEQTLRSYGVAEFYFLVTLNSDAKELDI